MRMKKNKPMVVTGVWICLLLPGCLASRQDHREVLKKSQTLLERFCKYDLSNDALVAQELVESALREDSSSAELFGELSLIYLARKSDELLPAALVSIDRGIKLQPSNLDLRVLRYLCYGRLANHTNLNKYHDLAKKEIFSILDADSCHRTGLLYAIAYCIEHSKDPLLALHLLQKKSECLSSDTSTEKSFFCQAELTLDELSAKYYYRLNKSDSLFLLESTPTWVGDKSTFYAHLGRFYSSRSPELARKYLNLSVSLDSLNGLAWMTLGEIFEMNTNSDSARIAYQIGLSRDPTFKIELLRRIALLNQSRGDLRGAIENLEEILSVDSNFYNVHSQLADLNAELGNKTEALRYLANLKRLFGASLSKDVFLSMPIYKKYEFDNDFLSLFSKSK